MRTTCFALAAAMALASCSGCCVCRKLFPRRATVIPTAPACAPAPTCCPTAPCGECDSCGCNSGAPMGYGDSGLSYPMEAPQMMYENPTLPPG